MAGVGAHPRRLSFNGAGDLHHRKGPVRASRSAAGRCFNGAGDLHHRKVADDDHRPAGGGASTEPVIFITGKHLDLILSLFYLFRFNGAGDLHHRKARQIRVVIPYTTELQRSR